MRKRENEGALGEDLLGRESVAGSGFGRGIALLQLGGAEGPSIDQEAVDPTGLLDERLTQDRWSAFRRYASASVGPACPVDVPGDDVTSRGRGKPCGISRASGRRGNRAQGGEEHDRTKHRYLPL